MPEYRIMVCKECRFAVPPGQIRTHLTENHADIPVKGRREIADTVQDLDDLAQVKEDVIYPEASAAAVKGLPVHNDGFRCVSEDEHGKQCEYVCRTIQGIQKHCRREHGWVNGQKRGGNGQAKDKHPVNGLWQEGQSCQRFFTVSTWKRYFQVMRRERAP